MDPTFRDLLPTDALRQAVADLGFSTPTPIQVAALPPLFAGRDVLGRASTGTGKTLAYALPLIARVNLGLRRVQALVLCPTRELAQQVTADVRALGKRCPGLRVVLLAGGQPRVFQARTLAEGAHVVVGTPGRVLDLLRRGDLDPRVIHALVLDEADRMLELGFAAEVEAIRALLPAERQTALFSATFPPAIEALSAGWQADPVVIEVAATTTEIRASFVEVGDKRAALDTLLRAGQPDAALVFCNFKRVASETAAWLVAAGHAAEALHGDLEQAQRDRVLAGFRSGAVRVVVATDVAARGLDVDGLPLVVNFELPANEADYVHRIGRTGRAGRVGDAWSLVGPDDPDRRPSGATAAPLPAAVPGAPPLRSEWVTLWVGAGRSDKLRPGDLLGAFTGDCGLSAGDVGKFEIAERHAYVAVKREIAKRAVAGLARHGVKGKRVRVELA